VETKNTMKLTDLEVVQITNALRADREGILNQSLVYKTRHKLNKIVDELAVTYKAAYVTHDNILKEKYNGKIEGKEIDKFQAFQLDWTSLLKESSGEYNIEKIPVELLEDIKMNAFQENGINIINREVKEGIKESITEAEIVK
jgi:hypothetical protein